MSLHPVPDAALDADIATIAQKGAGKTYTNRGMVERLLDQSRRVVVLDPLNSWWGLKALANGKPGYPVAVVGGPNADVPLDPHAGEKLGAFIASSDISVVVDVSELKRGEMLRFTNDFLAALYRHNRDPLWLVLEEADVFAPQQPMGDATMLLHHVDQIARRGRARGFRLWTITQRPAKLHKDILTQTSTLIMLRIRSPQDRAAAEAWIVGNAEAAKAREISASLSALPVGTGWVWAPDHDLLAKVAFPPIRTLDTSATPQAGAEPRQVGKLAQVDLGALTAALAPEPKAAPAAKPGESRQNPADIAAAERRGFERGLTEGFEAGWREGQDQVLRQAQAALRDLRLGAPVIAGSPISRPETIPRAVAPAGNKAQAAPSAGVTSPQQRILDALAWWAAFGLRQPTNEQVGFIAGYAPGSGNFNNLKSGLRSAGLIDYPGAGAVSLTDAGLSKARAPDSGALTNAHFHDQVRAKLTFPQLKVFEPILAAYPAPMAVDEVAAASGYAVGSGNFNNLRSSLRSINLIAYPAAGSVRAADWLFPEGK